jgi:ketosteroid isomerase-like protein
VPDTNKSERPQYLASATGDMDLWRQVVALDIEWTESAGFPLAGTYRRSCAWSRS